jgi:hypothetical protein
VFKFKKHDAPCPRIGIGFPAKAHQEFFVARNTNMLVAAEGNFGHGALELSNLPVAPAQALDDLRGIMLEEIAVDVLGGQQDFPREPGQLEAFVEKVRSQGCDIALTPEWTRQL